MVYRSPVVKVGLSSTPWAQSLPEPVICLMKEQITICNLDGWLAHICVTQPQWVEPTEAQLPHKGLVMMSWAVVEITALWLYTKEHQDLVALIWCHLIHTFWGHWFYVYFYVFYKMMRYICQCWNEYQKCFNSFSHVVDLSLLSWPWFVMSHSSYSLTADHIHHLITWTLNKDGRLKQTASCKRIFLKNTMYFD